MIARQSLPRPEDFGLTADIRENEPVLIVERQRGALCAVALTALLIAAVAVTAWKTGSVPAALFLAPILIVAWLILLLPLIMGCVSLAGKLEETWRSSRDPEFRGWLRYRRALSECEVERDEQRSFERKMRWLDADRGQLCTAVLEVFSDSKSVESLDRQATGADLLVDDQKRLTVIRCESGSAPADAGVGRELAMARLDLHADDAVLVAPAGATHSLLRYLDRHPVRVLDAQILEALESGSNRSID